MFPGSRHYKLFLTEFSSIGDSVTCISVFSKNEIVLKWAKIVTGNQIPSMHIKKKIDFFFVLRLMYSLLNMPTILILLL